MKEPKKRWRTLANGGRKKFATEAEARQHAEHLVGSGAEQWVGIEQWSPEHPQDYLNEGWAMVDTVEGTGGTHVPGITDAEGNPVTPAQLMHAIEEASAAQDDDMSCPVTDCRGKIEARAPFWMGISPEGRPFLDGIGWAEGGVFSCSHGGEEHVPQELVEKYAGLVAAYCDAAEQMLGAAQGEAQIRRRAEGR